MTKATAKEPTKNKGVVEVPHYEISSDVPIPQIVQGRSKYPFEMLNVGQSFFEACTPAKLKATKANLISASRRVEKKTGAKFLCVVRTKKDEEGLTGKDGVRCWRLPDEKEEVPDLQPPNDEQVDQTRQALEKQLEEKQSQPTEDFSALVPDTSGDDGQ